MYTEDDNLIPQEDGSYIYIFERNDEVTLEFEDYVGNKKTQTLKVDWIEEKPANVEINYSGISAEGTVEATNQNVTATLTSNELIEILNNNNSASYVFIENGTFTFKYKGENGVIGYATASIDWIEKDLPYNYVSYSTVDRTEDNVIASVSFEENVTILNTDGVSYNSNTNAYEHVFSENGEFEFIYKTNDGTMGVVKTKVDWIVDNAYIKGDLNRDGKVDLTDILIELKIYFGSLKANDYQLLVGDMNDDSNINLSDVLLLLKAYFKK